MIEIEIARQHPTWTDQDPRIAQVVRAILRDHGAGRARISLAVVDDAAIHAMNRRYLNHDYATDVLSFLLEDEDDWLEGEIVVSADTAAEVAGRLGWSAADELLLYVVHAALHLVGYDDQTPPQLAQMREKEAFYLQACGVNPRYESAGTAGADPLADGRAWLRENEQRSHGQSLTDGAGGTG